MKELETKISDILDNIEWCYHGIDGRTETQTLLVKEVKDIAIEFSKYFFAESLRNLEASKDWSELFDQFIKQKYATP